MKCKNCKENFHYCNSCDIEIHKDKGFCCETCWKESKEYKEKYQLLNSFYNNLLAQGKNDFVTIIKEFDIDFILDFFQRQGIKL